MSDRVDAARSALVLGGCVLCAIVLLGTVQRLTAGRIAAAHAARLAAALADVLPDAPFDNDPVRDRVLVRAAALGDDTPRPIYRARLGTRPVGAVLSVVAPDGYSGAIELLVGVRADGSVTSVRVGEHRETPGLGDRIERRRSDWITSFDGRSLATGGEARWRVTRGGANGTFDALSGATITSRAVVGAVRRALVWLEAHRDTVFGP